VTAATSLGSTFDNIEDDIILGLEESNKKIGVQYTRRVLGLARLEP